MKKKRSSIQTGLLSVPKVVYIVNTIKMEGGGEKWGDEGRVVMATHWHYSKVLAPQFKQRMYRTMSGPEAPSIRNCQFPFAHHALLSISEKKNSDSNGPSSSRSVQWTAFLVRSKPYFDRRV